MVDPPARFGHPDWLYELSYDGFRAVARIKDGRCQLVSWKGSMFASFSIGRVAGEVHALLPSDYSQARRFTPLTRSRAGAPALHFLLQAFYQIQIGKHAVVAKDASFSVGGHQDGTDGFNPGGIGGQKLFPEIALPYLYIQTIDTGRQLARFDRCTESDRPSSR
jgi:hypothetical protein